MFWKISTPSTPTDPHQEQRCLSQVKTLTQALMVSGTVNIVLLAFVLYGLFGNGILVFRESLRPRLWQQTESTTVASDRTIGQVLQSYQQLSLEQLIAKLDDTTPIQNGYSERDLALGYLVWRHHFNIMQALVEAPPTTHKHLPIRTGQHATQLTLYPGLTPRQYAAVIHYAKTERWPLTSEGLFYELQRQPAPGDASLIEAFFLTPEFLTLHFHCYAEVNLNHACWLRLAHY